MTLRGNTERRPGSGDLPRPGSPGSIRIVNAPRIHEPEVANALGPALERHLARSPQELERLEVTVDGGLDGLNVVARLPQSSREYIARGQAEDIGTAVDRALARLAEKLSTGEAYDRSQREYPTGLPRLREAARLLNDDERTRFDDIVREHLGTLKRFVEQELDYLRSAALVSGDYPGVEDVVDEALVRALEDLPYRTEVVPVSSWLTAHATAVLEQVVARARGWDREGLTGVGLRRLRRLHDSTGGWHPSSTSGGTALAGAVTVGDDTHVTVPDPERCAAREEVCAYLLEVLADLPTRWRRAVMFRHLDGQPLGDVAAALGLSPDAVETILDHAEAFLRARLEEDDVVLSDSASLTDYLEWPAMPDDVAADLEADLSEVVSSPS